MRGMCCAVFRVLVPGAVLFGAVTLGAIVSPLAAPDAPVDVALKLDGGGVHVPRPSYTQAFGADVTAGEIGNARSPEKIDRNEWAYVVPPGLDITFDSPDPSLGRRWTVAVSGGVMNYSNHKNDEVTPAGNFLAGGRVITPRITGGTTGTAPGAGAEVVLLRHSDAVSRFVVVLRYRRATRNGVLGRPDHSQAQHRSRAMVVRLRRIHCQHSTRRVAGGVQHVGSGYQILERRPRHRRRSRRPGPPGHHNRNERLHQPLPRGYGQARPPDVHRQRQGGTPPVTVSDNRDLWGVQGGGKLSVAVNFSDQVTFSVSGEMDALSHIPYADVPDSSPTSGPLNAKSDGSVPAGVTAGLRIRF